MATINQSIADTKLYNNAAIIAYTTNMIPFKILLLDKSNASTVTGKTENIIRHVANIINEVGVFNKSPISLPVNKNKNPKNDPKNNVYIYMSKAIIAMYAI
ncbi:hypothetical protein NYT36_01540 [Staphylococcus aureus]|uniref:hypothetical protein n=1 Tax=Staphylococcus aureus TaxID=1280 RepID=UPI002175EE94|nr:hypothetical protein [Staphylococcus aureus]MCS5342896.1 hypothetical protein [Staphylococcus aureus]MCS5353265.1 hypothetical protein [Staphylococcus aureus]MDG6488617.1 hypothetical protein [Staphylococcus aureus]